MKMYKGKLLGILGCILVTISFAIFMPLSIRFLVNNILARRALPWQANGLSRVTTRVVCGSPRSSANRSASGASSSAYPRSSSKATVTVRGGWPAAAASAVSAVESIPDERNAPTGTSETR